MGLGARGRRGAITPGSSRRGWRCGVARPARHSTMGGIPAVPSAMPPRAPGGATSQDVASSRGRIRSGCGVPVRAFEGGTRARATAPWGPPGGRRARVGTRGQDRWNARFDSPHGQTRRVKKAARSVGDNGGRAGHGGHAGLGTLGGMRAQRLAPGGGHSRERGGGGSHASGHMVVRRRPCPRPAVWLLGAAMISGLDAHVCHGASVPGNQVAGRRIGHEWGPDHTSRAFRSHQIWCQITRRQAVESDTNEWGA